MLLCRSAFNKENRLSPIIIHDPLINTCQIKYEPSKNTVYGYIPVLKLGNSYSSIEIYHKVSNSCQNLMTFYIKPMNQYHPEGR